MLPLSWIGLTISLPVYYFIKVKGLICLIEVIELTKCMTCILAIMCAFLDEQQEKPSQTQSASQGPTTKSVTV